MITESHGHAEKALAVLKRHGDALADFFSQILAHYRQNAPAPLLEAIEYSLLAGGKRLRPALVLESYAACTSDSESKSVVLDSAIAAAGAIELIHTFSLVHDDLPAMDNDDLRRGKPTNHKVFGEAMAVLAGDAMVTMAFELLASRADPAVASRLIAELAWATGPCGMIGGQVLDMLGENKALFLQDLQKIHRMKTGALLATSCRLGAIAARAQEAQLQALTCFGRHMGLAFQIVDDILDLTSTPEQLGKATNKDADRGKNTYPSVIGLDASREQARQQLAAALEALSSFPPSADGLRNLARFVVEREI